MYRRSELVEYGRIGGWMPGPSGSEPACLFSGRAAMDDSKDGPACQPACAVALSWETESRPGEDRWRQGRTAPPVQAP